jgi:predicted DNA-binding transcriptional regulator
MDDRVLGGVILVGSLLGAACYFWLVFLSPWSLLVIQVSAFAAVAAVLVIVAWIGYTLATTPPPAPLEDFSGGLGVGGSGIGVGGEDVEETKK